MLTLLSKLPRRVVLSLLVCAAAGTSPAAQGQSPTATRVVGYVYTANNSAIVDVQVQLRDTVSGGVLAVTRTNAEGAFTFAATAGAYVIEVVTATGSVMAIGHPFTVAVGETVATFVRLGNTLPTFMPRSRWELATGVIGSWRRGSGGGSPGLGLLIGYNAGGPTFVADFSGVRRDGHNDWRALGGLRFGIVESPRAVLSAHAGAGALIRSAQSGLALAAGLGVDVGGPGRAAFRLQAEVTRDTASGQRATGARASVWIVVR